MQLLAAVVVALLLALSAQLHLVPVEVEVLVYWVLRISSSSSLGPSRRC